MAHEVRPLAVVCAVLVVMGSAFAWEHRATTVLALGSSGQTGAAPALPRYDVRRADSPIVIDGQMTEPAWQRASPPAALQALWDYQTGPAQGTAVRMLWTDEALFVGYEVEDADITAQYLERDDPTYMDDAVEIFLNPRPEQAALYYGLEMNARAVLYDYVMYAMGQSRFALKRFDMQGVKVASHLRGTLNARGDTDRGWSLEVSIPWANFTDMAPRPEVGTVWKANLNRWDGVPPDRRMSIWADPLQPRSNPHVPERFGDLRFVE